MASYGFVKVAAAAPDLRVADPEYNIVQIAKLLKEADAQDAALVVFPELCLTGYTCGDLFGQQLLLDKTLDCLAQLLQDTRDTSILALLGLPLSVDHKLYNCAVAIQQGKILGVVPKTYIPNYKEYYEKRWFSSGYGLSQQLSHIKVLGQTIPFGNLIFRSEEPVFALGVEICEDLWAPIPPSSYLAINGATIIANLSASNELVSKADYRRQLVAQQSARCICGYVYASAGANESTTDLVFGAECLVAENGLVLQSSDRFRRENTLVYAEIDGARLASERLINKSFADSFEFHGSQGRYQTVDLVYGKAYPVEKRNFVREIAPYPFVPDNPHTRDERCAEIFNIQVAGLAKRLEHTGLQKAVIGVSGGLDSTLALLVTAKTFAVLGISPENILAITMPGFGTSKETYTNALALMQAMRVAIREIDIRPACLQHFQDIGHDKDIHDLTYENTQARERTQILMDIANKINGLVIGTGDLSELALGWCTYNGDHMSMYSVNCGVPKTLVRFLVQWVAENVVDQDTKAILEKILATPISPELLPTDAAGNICQKTEETIGPYELHDFFLYYAVRHGMPPQKILFLAGRAFRDKYPAPEIKKWLRVFYLRFFSQQFKRSCLPDGPKVGTISLSPRGDWRMPSDAQVQLWLAELDNTSSF